MIGLVVVQTLIVSGVVFAELRRPITHDFSFVGLGMTAVLWIITLYALLRNPNGNR